MNKTDVDSLLMANNQWMEIDNNNNYKCRIECKLVIKLDKW